MNGPVEEPGRPHAPVTGEIAGSNPAGTATYHDRGYRFCSKHNIANPCPVCADRALIWELLQILRQTGIDERDHVRAVLAPYADVISRVERGI